MATPARVNVLVIGAGVSGLTTAICLAESGLPVRVRVMAKDRPERTTSAQAGAIWWPCLVDDPQALEWSDQTLGVLRHIAEYEPDSGVRLTAGVDATAFALDPPNWVRSAEGFRLCTLEELPSGYVSGWRYQTPLLDMPTYLAYLETRLNRVGVHVEINEVTAIAPVAAGVDLVVNCTGLGARDLVADAGMTPVRGQLVVVENPGIDWFFQDHAEGEELTYFLPHGDLVVLGGSATEGFDDQAPDPKIAEGIVERCARVEPRLALAKVLEHRVGLRPNRSHIRIEREDIDGCPVIHNYGHGGSGITVSWGCARAVLGHVSAWLRFPGLPAPAKIMTHDGDLRGPVT